ncbi:hypothetical protein [Amycolatopsis sp. 195334CR]|uniref:hypothetical protein n=1 Tax=Amycolatopsis sp. 195334CR TaxID=2814588 RepID=UPI001A8D7C20|nr:hypothetical protein [Amycolatopsis sp. 195334CR]MBN6037479.1 hypothetical protein [Amycolatopsis sp. 195334CR]
MAKDSLTIRVNVDGLRPTLRALAKLPKDASNELRDASLRLSQVLAARAKADGMGDPAPQSPLVASTVKAQRDRVPVISAGGTRRLGRNKAPAYKLLFGSVFGSNSYAQFHRPHGGNSAYWFFPVVEESAAEISAAWNRAADAVIRKFSEGG